MSNGGMQPTYGPVTDNTCPTVGGNQTIVNGNEADVIPKHEVMGVRVGDLSYEDDSHVEGVWATGVGDFAGS